MTLCEAGSGAGQCEGPQGTATDFETGRIYVADSGNQRIDVFEEDGSPAFSFPVGATPTYVAVDNVPGSGSRHDVYVADSGSTKIRKFDPAGNLSAKSGKGPSTRSRGSGWWKGGCST